MPKCSTQQNKPCEKCLPNHYQFQDLDHDLLALEAMMIESNLKETERRQVMNPLISLVPDIKLKTKSKEKKYYSKLVCWTLFPFATLMAILFLVGFTMKYGDKLNWHISALFRIFMIKILPYFDWRYLKDEMCLIPKITDRNGNVQYTTQPEVFNCYMCEATVGFENLNTEIEQPDLTELIQQFADVDRPIVVDGGIDHWIKKTADEFVDQILQHKEFARSIPCNLCSNIFNALKDDISLKEFFQKKASFDNFFMHFQNCDLDAMKIFRNYTYRPSYIPDTLSPVTFNWLLWNKDYSTVNKNYKKLNLVEKHTVIGQIAGQTLLRLIPRENCASVCPLVDDVLHTGQVLIITSLWDVEYLPEGQGENMAVVLEIKG